MSWKQGDILAATNRAKDAGRHYIVYFNGRGKVNFIGGMLTHSAGPGNLPMRLNHFLTEDDYGNSHKFQFDKTYLVKAKLKKFHSWGPFTKVGELSDTGVALLIKTIGHLEEETWEEYLASKRSWIISLVFQS